MSQPVFDTGPYFRLHLESRGLLFNDMGIRFLAINRYLTNFLDSDEPFPPSDGFMREMVKDITPERFPNFTNGPADSQKPLVDVPRRESDIKKLFEEINLDVFATVSTRKEAKIAFFIQAAQVSFFYAHAYFFLCRLVADLQPPALPETEADTRGLEKVFLESIQMLLQADVFMERANRKLGEWIRQVEELRDQKRKTHPVNRAKQKKAAKIKQWIHDTYYKIEKRAEKVKHPYILANEMQAFWVPSGPNDPAPSPETIVRHLRMEKLI